MQINEKIKKVRELNQLTQEEMAMQLNMSTNGYAKIERGKTRLNIPTLEKIATVLGIDLVDLLSIDDKSLICLVSENSQYSSNYYGVDNSAEIERMQLMLDHKEQLLIQKEREIEALKLALSAFQKT
ncbi:helix-turn-helix domain-containing protein [Neisseria sp. Dent CA1/247]|uniref:helix-turn-helix domain-containing protein n=1 Tax=Neisseria sp. Dent CA1/247 TaxID=2912675 RepID=UPI001FD05D90|nr:helix-turn-helix transcriptional regulator [Neisseria sp. Dent CA1/247]UOO75995.1 helix-turn-helix domain-containing protein [Neisseria sp. Dent CA1/247]